MLLALNPQAKANGPGAPMNPAHHRTAPNSSQNSGANKPSTAFSLAVSAVARRISLLSSPAVSRPTSQLNCLRARGRFSGCCPKAANTSPVATARLRPARALAIPIINKGLVAGCHIARRSIPQPAARLPPTSRAVIAKPAKRSLQVFSPAQASAQIRNKAMAAPIAITGW